MTRLARHTPTYEGTAGSRQPGPTDDTVGRTLYRLRYPALVLLLVGVAARHALRGHWIGDFWEHSAVVRELATHPLHPLHPLLAIDAPHALENPYALLIALVCRLTGVSAVTGLAMASVANLVMLVVALLAFVRRFAPAPASAVAFYLLLFVLLLWGVDPWDYSGFYHVGVILHTLAYPSAFALWLALLLLTLNEKRITDDIPRLLALIVPMSIVVLLSHPPTFLFVATGLVAMAVDIRRRLVEALIAIAVLALSVVVALAWPYFSFWTLMTVGSEPHARNAVMYSHPLLRAFPALLGLPPLLLNARRTRRWRLVAWSSLLFVIYIFGFVSGEYIYGRVIFFLVFLLQLELAGFIARRETSSAAGGGKNSWMAWTGAVLATCAVLSMRPLVNVARDLRAPATYADYFFLRRSVGQYDVMMVEPPTTWIAPSFGGKLVAPQNPLPFVAESDQTTRRADVRAFFSAATPELERRALLRKYRVSFVLAPRAVGADSAKASDSALRALGSVAHADDRFLLIRVDSSIRR